MKYLEIDVTFIFNQKTGDLVLYFDEGKEYTYSSLEGARIAKLLERLSNRQNKLIDKAVKTYLREEKEREKLKNIH